MILSHWRAGSGAVVVSTREESRLVLEIIAELPPDTEVCTVAAPMGIVRNARTGIPESGIIGLTKGYEWLGQQAGRVLIVFDWHVLVNAPGTWRGLIEALPYIRSPKNAAEGAAASLVVFVGPHWDLQPTNPLRGAIPILQFAAPNREAIKRIATSIAPINGEADSVADALSGLAADTAEQAAAECRAEKGTWDIEYLRSARKQLIRESGLEIWPTTPELGGLGGIKNFADTELFPWVRDTQLSVRRVLCCGLPGGGKSFCARWLAHRMGCECARLSIPALKGGLVGSSEANLKRALRSLDALGAESPIVCVLDEIDTIAREGLDGGTSSGMFAELLTWLQESTAQVVVVATLNRLDKLDAALSSRMQSQFWFDLPTRLERAAVASIHYKRLGCHDIHDPAQETADCTEGYSSREIAEHVCPSVARLSKRMPSRSFIKQVTDGYTPASKSQEAQLDQMRKAASSLRRANDPIETDAMPRGRRLAKQ